MGADYLASGHYARVKALLDGYRLLKASDLAKDQSYFLYALGQSELEYLLLPLGNLRKEEVRRLAAARGLATSCRQSQDICFIPDGDYRSFLVRYIPTKPGDIVDTSGQIVGAHSGLAGYTVGQRQGLGLSSPERRYVLELDVRQNRLVVGTKDELLRQRLMAGKLSWVAGRPPQDLHQITAKLRYQSRFAPISLYLRNGTARVEFHEPQSAVTPGQAIVFYQGDVVLGGGIIEESFK
jgi:tRNA-specific 2-thiouridylase